MVVPRAQGVGVLVRNGSEQEMTTDCSEEEAQNSEKILMTGVNSD